MITPLRTLQQPVDLRNIADDATNELLRLTATLAPAEVLEVYGMVIARLETAADVLVEHHPTL